MCFITFVLCLLSYVRLQHRGSWECKCLAWPAPGVMQRDAHAPAPLTSHQSTKILVCFAHMLHPSSICPLLLCCVGVGVCGENQRQRNVPEQTIN